MRNRTEVYFLVVVCVFSVWLLGEGLELLAGKIDPGYSLIKAFEELDGEVHDVVFLGDSTTSQSVNPETVFSNTSYSGYNLAMPGTGYIGALGLLKEYILNNRSPKMVVIGLYINRQEKERGLPPVVYYSLRADHRQYVSGLLHHFGDESVDLQYKMLNGVEAFKHRGVLESALKVIIQGNVRVPEVVQGHLALEVKLNGEAEIGASRREMQFDTTRLVKLLQFCKDEGIDVLLFEPPGSPGGNALVHERDAMFVEIQTLIAEHMAKEFCSFNQPKILFFEEDKWVNADHLNKFGAKKFSSSDFRQWVLSHLLESQGMQSPVC